MNSDILSNALVITTYNSPTMLELVLLSVKQQIQLPDEVIIADDGSGDVTKALITRMQADYPIRLLHCWHEDKGFRAGQIRNKAIAMAKSEYIILIDGDMVLEKHFIYDHLMAACRKHFIQGSRVILDQTISTQAFMHKMLSFPRCSRHLSNRLNTLRFPLISHFISKWLSKNNLHAIRSCNMSFWRKDFIHINGFNEAFTGWGREDSEFVARLLNYGIKRYNMRLAGVAYHLYHPENSRHNLSQNDQLLQHTLDNNATWCEKGVNQYL